MYLFIFSLYLSFEIRTICEISSRKSGIEPASKASIFPLEANTSQVSSSRTIFIFFRDIMIDHMYRNHPEITLIPSLRTRADDFHPALSLIYGA